MGLSLVNSRHPGEGKAQLSKRSSQNHKLTEVGQVLQRPCSPNPRPKQVQLKQVIYSFVQLSSEYLQEESFHNFFGHYFNL